MESEQIPKTSENIKDAVAITVSQVNRLMYHKGFSPAQWVLGYEPQRLASISSDQFHVPQHERALNSESFANEIQKRQAAAEAFF